MAHRNSNTTTVVGLGNSAIDLDDERVFSKPYPASGAKLRTTARLQPCDSSMFDLTLPFSHATSVVRRVFSEGLLLLRLAVRLWTYLGVGWKWSIQLLRLVLYAMLLLPGFLQMIAFYVFSPRVQRSIAYGTKPRQRLDLYYPKHQPAHGASPVVIYITGGAWTIGYKAWGALLARRLSQQGVLVACLDYRNFPQGDALDMLEDVNTGIAWVLDRVHRFGGDPDCVTLVGQSAGGHLAGLATIKQAQQAALGRPALGASPAWSPGGLRAFVGVSGAYDLPALAEHLHRRGLYKNLFERIMSLSTDNEQVIRLYGTGNVNGNGVGPNSSGQSLSDCAGSASSSASDCDNERLGGDCSNSSDLDRQDSASTSTVSDGSGLRRLVSRHDASGCMGGARPAYGELSPLQVARRLCPRAAALLPYTLLIHGTADKTVPAEGSAKLAEAFEAAGAPRCRCVLVPGKTHTAFLLEDPMRGGRDLLMDTVMEAVAGSGPGERRQGDHLYTTLCPGFLCDLAGWVCPF